MRMWLVDPRIMCRQHLLGEHFEVHVLLIHLQKNRKIKGYLENNCLEPRSIYQRHQNLMREMIRRGYNHNSSMMETDFSCVGNLSIEQQYWKINKEKSLKTLLERCKECNDRNVQIQFASHNHTVGEQKNGEVNNSESNKVES